MQNSHSWCLPGISLITSKVACFLHRVHLMFCSEHLIVLELVDKFSDYREHVRYFIVHCVPSTQHQHNRYFTEYYRDREGRNKVREGKI